MKPDLNDLFSRALRRIRSGAAVTLQGTAIAGALASTAATGCSDATAPDESGQMDGPGGKGDWAQDEGERNTALVSWTGEAWSECRDSSSRAGCYGYEMFVKVLVKNVSGVDPTAKKVGVVFTSVDQQPSSGPRTANGYYFTTHSDGREEWHVPMRVYTYEDLVKFNVWFQPGNGATYYDDNNGEMHVFANNNAQQVIQAAPWESEIIVENGRVTGRVRVRVADIDHDKLVGMHATVDGWNTVLKFGIGNAGEKNKFYWAEDLWGSYEYWQMDLDITGVDIEQFRYAVYYEHGTVNDARRQQFWDNNWGGDYLVERATPPSP